MKVSTQNSHKSSSTVNLLQLLRREDEVDSNNSTLKSCSAALWTNRCISESEKYVRIFIIMNIRSRSSSRTSSALGFRLASQNITRIFFSVSASSKQASSQRYSRILDEQYGNFVKENLLCLLGAHHHKAHLKIQLTAWRYNNRTPAHNKSRRFSETVSNRPDADWSMIRTSV